MSRNRSHENTGITDLGVARIGESQGQPITCESDIDRLVEEPAREACIDLFLKNVLTVSSSAHDGEQIPYIDIDVESLSEDNREVLWSLIDDEKAGLIPGQDSLLAKIKLNDLRKDRTSEEISKAFLDITVHFTTQPLTRGFYDVDELKKLYGYTPEEYDDVSADDFVTQGYVLDEPTGLLFESKELIDQYRTGIGQQ